MIFLIQAVLVQPPVLFSAYVQGLIPLVFLYELLRENNLFQRMAYRKRALYCALLLNLFFTTRNLQTIQLFSFGILLSAIEQANDITATTIVSTGTEISVLKDATVMPDISNIEITKA